MEPVARSGKSTILEFFSREAVEDEKKSLEKELAKWKLAVKNKDATIAQRNDKIAESEQRRELIKPECRT